MTDVNTIEATLKSQQWVGGQQPTAADREAFDAVKDSNISAETHPYAFAWFCLISKFSDAVRGQWAAGGAAAKGGKAKGGKKGGKKEEVKKVEAPADDMDDLFGDDDDDGADAAAAQAAVKAKAAEKKKNKPKVIAKSSVMFAVNPIDDTTDLDALFTKITTEVVMDGLIWGVDMKKEPVAFGIFKLIVCCVVEDEKVSVDDLEEKITAWEDVVNSV